jgi:pimeloyl-ACP methyl ester carboxylesterase
MRSMTKRTLFLLAVTTVFLLTVSGAAYAQTGVTKHSGTLADGATYLIAVSANWNGTLFLYSHRYVIPGTPNPAQDVSKDDPFTRAFLLAHRYALAGSSYAMTGWAIEDARRDQIAVLDIFNLVAVPPKRTIAWGHSLGGIITAGLIQRHPERFDAALPMCGVLSGGVATWNTALDSAFAFKTLIGPPGLQLVNITNPLANLHIAEVAQAQATPQGRARIALAGALGNLPGWFMPLSPEPAPTDFVD